MRARCSIVERDEKNNIVFLKDLSPQFGGRSITNDAEAVVNYYRSIYGNRVRVVYLDTDSEWWELVWQADGMWDSDFSVSFKPWHGLVWDKLSKVES
jgi:hypothetical protein